MRCSRQPAGRGFPAWVLGLAIPKRTSYSQGMQKQASIRSVDPVDSLVRRSLYALKMRAKTPGITTEEDLVAGGGKLTHKDPAICANVLRNTGSPA